MKDKKGMNQFIVKHNLMPKEVCGADREGIR
jgi:hypothetical protein